MTLKDRIKDALIDEININLLHNFDIALQEAYAEIEKDIRLDPDIDHSDESDCVIDVDIEGQIYINGSYDYYYTDELFQKIAEYVKKEL